MHPGNGCGNFTIGMIFLTEVKCCSLGSWPLLDSCSTHTSSRADSSRSWEGTLLSGHCWGVVLKQPCVTDYSAYYIEWERFFNNFNMQPNIF